MHVFFLQRYERTVGGIGATFGLQFATENVSVFWLTVIDTNIIHTHTHNGSQNESCNEAETNSLYAPQAAA